MRLINPMKRYERNHNKSKGFTLIELSIVVAIMTLLLSIKLNSEAMDMKYKLAEAQGKLLSVLNSAVYEYSIANQAAVIANTAVSGVATTRQPTVAELRTLGYLTNSFNATSLFQTGYVTRLSVTPTACSSNCSVVGLVWLDGAMRDPSTNQVSPGLVARAREIIGGDGAASVPAGANLLGPNGSWSVANPVAGTPIGILAARNGAGSALDTAGFYKVDGSRPLTANLNAGGFGVAGLRSVTSGAVCSTSRELAMDAAGAVMTCQSGLWTAAGGGSAYWKDPVANFASLPVCDGSSANHTRVVQTPSVGSGPRTYTCSGGVWQAIAQDDNGAMVVAGNVSAASLMLSSVIESGTACTVADLGKIARNSMGAAVNCVDNGDGTYSYVKTGKNTSKVSSESLRWEDLFSSSPTSYTAYPYSSVPDALPAGYNVNSSTFVYTTGCSGSTYMRKDIEILTSTNAGTATTTNGTTSYPGASAPTTYQYNPIACPYTSAAAGYYTNSRYNSPGDDNWANVSDGTSTQKTTYYSGGSNRIKKVILKFDRMPYDQYITISSSTQFMRGYNIGSSASNTITYGLLPTIHNGEIFKQCSDNRETSYGTTNQLKFRISSSCVFKVPKNTVSVSTQFDPVSGGKYTTQYAAMVTLQTGAGTGGSFLRLDDPADPLITYTKTYDDSQ